MVKIVKQKKESNVKKLEKELKEQKKLSEEYLNNLKRLKAEFENFQKRTDKEKKELLEYSNKGLILKFLDVLDNFELALKSVKNTENKDDIAKGVEMIFNQFKNLLEKEGVKAINAVNEIFNSKEHEAIEKINSKKPENYILEETRKGYKFKDMILRPSQVKISGKKNEK